MTRDDRAAGCATPTPFETLVALWTGELTGEAALALESHLFTCDSCAQASDRLGRLVAGLRAAIPPVMSHAQRDRLVAAGTRILETPVDAGVNTQARFAPELDLLVHALRVKDDLARAHRVDLQVTNEQGDVLFDFHHVPFDRARGEVLVACQRHFEHMEGGPGDPVFHLYAVEQAEQGVVRRPLGRYFVHHIWR